MNSFLKRQHTGHAPKKPNVFTAAQCKKFLDAPNNEYLSHKVRKNCLNIIHFNIYVWKIQLKSLWYQSCVTGLYDIWIARWNRKFYNAPIRRNTIAALLNKTAVWLKLKNAETYISHSVKRTSATVLADSGVNTLQLQRHGGWKSARVAEGYVQDSIHLKKKINKRIASANNEINESCVKKLLWQK